MTVENGNVRDGDTLHTYHHLLKGKGLRRVKNHSYNARETSDRSQMNRGLLQSFTVPQIMAAENPNWWIISNMANHPETASSPSPFLSPPLPSYFLNHQQCNNPPSPSSSNSSSIPVNVGWPSYENPDQFPESWSQLLLGGFMCEEEVGNMEQIQAKKMANWDDQGGSLYQAAASSASNLCALDIKQEKSSPNSFVYAQPPDDLNRSSTHKQSWSCSMVPRAANSSPSSCVTNFFNGNHNVMDFSSTSSKGDARHPSLDRPSDCSSNANGGALKRARVQPPSSSQPAFKGRKEKLGDRINALHQLVSPFGKTDTASVLLEAIGYIRFLQNQIEALSLPYLGDKQSDANQLHSPSGGDRSLLSDDPGQEDTETKKDLKSRGLCLVPVSCTLQVGSDNGADYWTPALGGGFR